MNDEILRTLNAKLVAQQRVIEALLSSVFAEGPAIAAIVTTELRNGKADAKRTLSDHGAEWWADVAVRAQEQIETMIANAEAMARSVDHDASESPFS